MATATWQPPPADQQNGAIDYVAVLTQPQTSTSEEFTTTDTSFNITGLLPFTEYLFRVAARTSAGVGPYTQEVLFKTPEDGVFIVHIKCVRI